jgi:hypothetical protein
MKQKIINVAMWTMITVLVVGVIGNMMYPTPRPEPTTQDVINYMVKQELEQRIEKAKELGLTPVYIVNQ